MDKRTILDEKRYGYSGFEELLKVDLVSMGSHTNSIRVETGKFPDDSNNKTPYATLVYHVRPVIFSQTTGSLERRNYQTQEEAMRGHEAVKDFWHLEF